MSDSLQSHGLQHTRPPCPSLFPKPYSNSCPLSGDAIQPSHPLLPPSPPALNLSKHQGLFQWVSSWYQVAKVLELQLQHQSFQWIFRVDFLRIDWLDLLTVQGTLKSLIQLHSLKTSILQCSAFFMVQLSHQYVTTGKIIALTRWTFVGKVMSLLFNMLSRFVSAFLLRSKCLNFMTAVTTCSDIGSQENKICYSFHWEDSWESLGPQGDPMVFIKAETRCVISAGRS